ncbi:UDP-2,3-diacylglucosamine diphosphatase [Pseudobacteriovorax antillogorgiicola]|uniref:Calcineurin-like phosphoesterase n=1 Tax=Pseudobacteriovorax antillogorgiicola TaxID=1513793 RepID=A0A1Y6CKW8_9BACT|nr:metallophosphoesterase [Pseudobacteriovorax antillogorgiicola]TCS46141.1 calcineurin-like phosphoesterase family protein [Pseudobacteriovorax antillogorgiicola]SMF69707.1 Calcineurin-like phosphoesterase [Pseudobacteriovorax antillogorgiicola]
MTDFNASLVVASDIHLHSAYDEKGRLLLKALRQVAEGNVEYFVFLGDIFDFCLGSHPYFQRRFEAIGAALEAVAASGTRVIYLEGNHEFRIKDFGWEGVEFYPSGEAELEISTGERFKMAHGDMIYSHERYKKFRKVVKSQWLTGAARLVPGPLMNWLATRGAHISRSQDEYRTINHDAILGAVYSWLETTAHDYGLFGHFHVPYAESRRDGRKGGVFSVDCWDKPNFLVFREGAFHRWLPQEASKRPQLMPAKPLLAGNQG